jgi:general stress protein CsbA
MCPRCSRSTEAAGQFCPNCGTAFTNVVTVDNNIQSAIKGNTNPVFVWLSIAVGSLGIISTFLTYATDSEGYSVNGWKSREVLDAFDKTSFGVYWILVASIATALTGLIHFTDLGHRQTKQTQGWSMIGVGVLTVIFAQVTFNAWDAAAIEVEEFVEIGAGLQLAYVVGVAIVIIGILCLTVPTFFKKTSAQSIN